MPVRTLSILRVLSNQPRSRFSRSRSSALVLLASLLVGAVPAPVGAVVLKDAVKRSKSAAVRTRDAITDWSDFLYRLGRTQGRKKPADPSPRGLRPVPAASKEEKEARAASLRLNASGDIVLHSREPMLFTAVPLDSEGNTIHGVDAEWESSDRQIVFIRKNGQAIGGKPGTAKLTARVGGAKESVRVTVVDGTKEDFGGKKRENSRRPERKIAKNVSAPALRQLLTKSDRKEQRAHSPARSTHLTNATSTMMLLRDPMDDPLPDEETGSLYQPTNAIGAPPGKTKPGGPPSTAVEAEETGNKNFTFDLPIVTLPGRGLDVSLNLTYNSLLYNKSTNPFDSTTWLTYDVDSGYPAPGFRLGYGQIEDQGGFGFTLTDPDGTRHSLNYTSANNYDTNDGTFIHFTGGSGWGTLFYPDGSRVSYGAAGGGFRSYPTQITDRNGNYIQISYQNGVGPRITSIKDTLGRFITLNYAANGDLFSITAPGLSGQPDREVMRFFYEDITLNSSTLFDPSVNVTLPASSHVIKYIFLQSSVESGNAHIGYRFDYSAYGMIYQTTKFRGMVLDGAGTAIANEGLPAAVTTYDYPGTPINTATGLTDCPKYLKRTDDWAGRTTGMNGDPNVAPFYSFLVNETTGVSTVTAPDGSVSETHAVMNPGQWNDGLISEVFIDKQGSSSLSHTVIDWEQDAGGIPRVASVRSTNEAGQTKASVFTYTTYNNVSVVSERDFTTDGTVSPTELRRTETTYVTSSAYTNRRLLHLPESVKIFAGGSSTPLSRVDYSYDNYGTNHANITPRNEIVMHDPAFDPFQQTVETNCRWECFDWEFHNCYDWQWVCDYYNPYDPSTDYRGNVTSLTTYPDATNTSNAFTHSSAYDIAGNLMSAQVNCCQLKTFSYTDSPDSHTYAYKTSETRGDPNGVHLTAGATYDLNTGLVATITDENGQVTTNYYNGESLRLDHMVSPDGGVGYLTYSDALEPDANGKNHYYVQSQTKLDAPGGTPRYITSRRYFDGRDAVARSLDNFTAADGYTVQDTEYDVMGRAYRSSNPYFANGYSSAINPSGFWISTAYDHLGRITVITMPRGDDNNSLNTTAQIAYDGIFTTVTNQAGKQRRQKLDALGRVVRLDEPDASGALGSTSSPNLATSYEYDALGNLVHVIQPGPNSIIQHRYFKFDSLSRMIRERQVEQTVNPSFNLSDPLTGNTDWTRKIDYNSDGLVSDVYDARGVHAQMSYDAINRVTTISYSDGTPTAHYFYDAQALPAGAPTYAHGYANGRLIAATYGSGAAGNYLGYDSMGRVNVHKQVTGSATYSLSYTYNFNGGITSETYPSGRTLNYVYDEAARLTNVNDGTTTFATAISYVAHGALKSETWGNGAVHSQAFNRRLQASEIKLKQSSAGAELQRFNYSYGQVNQADGAVDTSKNSGQIGRIDAFINGAGTKEWDQRFVHDELGRLSTAAEYQQGNNSLKSWQVQYTYDRWGNRFQSGSSNTGTGYVPVLSSDIDSATNRFVTGGATPTTYDAQGNITTDTKFRAMNYAYDANGRATSATRTDNTTYQTSVYDCTGQRVQTSANGVTRTMVYNIFGDSVAEYTGSSGNSLQRENIYRGGQLLSVIEAGGSSAAVPAGLSAALSGANVSLTWSAASGATNYRVERKAAGGSYSLVGTTASTNLTDTGVNSGSAYLYKVCAADGQGNCVSNFSNLALGTTITFATDPNIITITQDPSGAAVTTAKAAHINELRTGVNTVRNLAGLANATWTNPTVSTGSTISKDDVRDLREKLDEALVALSIQTSGYTDPTLAGAPNGTEIKGVHITELRQRVKSGTGTEGSGGGVCYKSITQFVKDFYQGVLKRQPNGVELQQKTDLLTQAQLQGQSQLIAAAQNLGTALFTSSEYIGLNTTNAQYITDLYAGYLQRAPDGPGYNFWLGILNGGETRPNIRQAFAVSTEFQNNVNALCIPASTGGGIKYVLSDVLGSARAIMNNGSYGSSSVTSRHDYLPFGEEIWAGTGLRSTAQGYNTSDKIRQKFAELERDDVTGLDHTVWRKYESLSGRWTSPDPYNGAMSVANPQTFNRYAYVQNDPVNLNDPTGLYWAIDWLSCRAEVINIGDPGADPILRFSGREICNLVWVDPMPFFPIEPPGGGGPQIVTPKKQTAQECRKKALTELAQELGSRQEIFASDSAKLAGILFTAAGGARTGAGIGSVILPGPGSVAGALVGFAAGATVGAFLSDLQEARVEAGPVQRFMQKDKQCQKLAKQEAAEARRNGPSMSAREPQMFVVTRQFGTFAMHSYTIRSGPTLLGDHIYTTFGPNPSDRVTQKFGP